MQNNGLLINFSCEKVPFIIYTVGFKSCW